MHEHLPGSAIPFEPHAPLIAATGAAITLIAYDEARQAGYRHGVLFGTELGVPVYRRIGLREVGTTIGRYLWYAYGATDLTGNPNTFAIRVVTWRASSVAGLPACADVDRSGHCSRSAGSDPQRINDRLPLLRRVLLLSTGRAAWDTPLQRLFPTVSDQEIQRCGRAIRRAICAALLDKRTSADELRGEIRILIDGYVCRAGLHTAL